MPDEQKSFKQLLDSTEGRPLAGGGGAVVSDDRPQALIYELRKRDETAQKRAVKNAPRMRSAFKVLTRTVRKRIVAVGLWALALGAVADFAYWALVEDERPVEKGKMSVGPKQQEAVADGATQPATPLPQTSLPQEQAHQSVPEEQSQQTAASAPFGLASEQSTNEAALPPDRSATAPASYGGYVVQVSSERSDTEAQASFKTLQSKYPSVLGGRSPLIRRVDLGEKGIVYRAQVGPFDTVDQAKQLCGSLKAAGGRCIVQRNS